MGGLFSKEKKTKQHESKVTEQDKAILVRLTKSFNYYDTSCEISNLLDHSCYFVHLVFKQMFANMGMKQCSFFSILLISDTSKLRGCVWSLEESSIFFWGGGGSTVVWVGQVPGPFLVTFLYVINELKNIQGGSRPSLPPPPFPVKFTAIN